MGPSWTAAPCELSVGNGQGKGQTLKATWPVPCWAMAVSRVGGGIVSVSSPPARGQRVLVAIQLRSLAFSLQAWEGASVLDVGSEQDGHLLPFTLG